MTIRRSLLVVALLAACGPTAREEASQSADMAMPTANPAPGADGFAGGARARRMSEIAVTSAQAAPPALPRQTVASTMLIRNGAVTIEVDSLERAIERVRQIAMSLGGMVGGLNMNTGEHQVRSATLELKIPAARFDSAMTGMPAIGKVEHSSSSVEDVGEEFVDITARVANAKRLEERLINLLATRTGKLEDVLAVERELARVRGEIERHEGRIRFLSTRVATSTISATVHEKAPVIAAHPGDNVITRAFINAWRNFVHLLTLGIEMLGVLVPLAAMLGSVYFAWRRWGRYLRTPRASV